MSEAPEALLERFWSVLLQGEHPSQAQALQAFEKQLASLAEAVSGAAAGESYEDVLRAFQTLATSALQPPLPPRSASQAAPARFTAAASQLQARLAEVHAAALIEMQAHCARDQPRTLQDLFDRWVICFEKHLFAQLIDDGFGAAFGDAVNASLECYRDTVQHAG